MGTWGRWRWTGALLAALAACGMGYLGLLARTEQQLRPARADLDYAYAVAGRLGRTEQSDLLWTSGCWERGLLEYEQCDVAVFFASPAGFDDFAQRVRDLGFFMNTYDDSLVDQNLFAKINLAPAVRSPDVRLTANGQEGAGGWPASAPPPEGQQWTLLDMGRRIAVVYYATAPTGARYELGARPVQGNIVEVRYLRKSR